MGIYDRQYRAVLSQELLRYLLEGRLPNLDELSERIAKALDKDGKTTYQYISQPSKTVFNIDLYNKSLNRIKFDIDLFQEELLDLLKDTTKRINYADLYYKVNSFELSRLKAKLDAILFTIENADFYFMGAFDNFSDVSKLDKKLSTPNILNLSEKCLQLPYGKSGVQKLKISHLNGFQTWPVEVVTPGPSDVISVSTVPGTAFSNIFIDTLSTWAVELKTRTQVPAEIKIVFPIAGAAQEEIEVFINKLQFVSHSSSKQKIKVRVSTDNVNYLPLVGYEDGLMLENLDTVYSMDFETNLVQYVELSFRKESPDSEISDKDGKAYQYIFGLKSFAALTTGRVLTATYYSKPFKFDSADGPVSKISIQSKYERPKDTNISYYVGKKIEGTNELQYLPINPVGKPTRSGISDTVVFSNNIQNSLKFTVDSAGPGAASPYGSPFQGKIFYKFGNPLNPKPIFGSTKLFRGFNSWYRDSSTAFEVIENFDTYVSFSATDTEALYTTAVEVPTYENKLNTTTNVKTVLLTTSKTPYYDSTKGHGLRPSSGIDVQTDIKPNYAIYSVLLSSANTRKNRPFVLDTSRSVELPSFNFIVQSSDSDQLPAVTTDSGILYTNGIDYILETEDVGGTSKPTGLMTIPDGSSLLNSSGGIATPGLQLRFVFTIDPDITHKVSRIEGRTITLDNAKITPGEFLSIRYRYIPTSPSEILKPSIRVSNLPSVSAQRTFYTEGTDYAVDSRTGTIQRISSGAIPEKGNVYIDYKYRSSTFGIQTFIIWAEVANTNGVQIKFELDPLTKKNRFIVDSAAGEYFYVNSPQGLLDLSRTTSTALLGPGWVQFIVRSKDPDSNVEYGSNLIDQIIQLRDSTRKRVFKEGNLYFSQLIAFREPMTEKTLNHLKVNTLLSDHNSFAIDNFTDPNNSYLVTNYKPTSSQELYTRTASEDEDQDGRPPLSGETYLLTWEAKSQNIDDSNSNIVIKIDIDRSSSADGSLTPKIFGYSIRASV